MSAANPFLDGPHAPVDDEVTIDGLEVVGELPAELRGQYVINSPNPRFTPQGRYHWFDGDGMVHGVHLVDGKATYRNRWVRTAAFLEEEEAGEPKWGGILDPINPNRAELDKDTGNTDLVWHNGKLLATWWLGGTPYALKVPSLETEGPVDFSGKLACNMAAHPKVDPKTGELLFFDYSPYQAPYLQYGVVSGDGAKVHTTTIEVPGPRLFHDIAITEKHTIFLDLPMLWDTSAVSKGKRKVAFDTELPSRFGVLPRHAEGSEVRWFELPPSYIYHTINAYEDGDEIVMYACRIENPIPTLPPDQDPGVPRLYFLRLEPYLTRYRFNMTTGRPARRSSTT